MKPERQAREERGRLERAVTGTLQAATTAHATGLVQAWPLAIFRIVFGLMYIDMALQKAPWRTYGWLHGFLQQEVAHPTLGWYAAFVRDTVLAHFRLFAMLTFLVEMTIGLALVLGAFTRVTGFASTVWQINIALGAWHAPGEWPWVWALLILPSFTFGACGAGRALGIDAALRRRFFHGFDSRHRDGP